MTAKKKLTDESAAENPAVAQTLAQHDDDALPGAPEAPKKRERKSEQLHVAFLPDVESHNDGFLDAAIFGTKLGAYEFAFDQEPKWDVVPIRKGESLHAAIHSA